MMLDSRALAFAAFVLLCGCSSDECVPTADVREPAVRTPSVQHPDVQTSDIPTPDVRDVRDPTARPVLARGTCVTSAFDKHGETFVQLASGATRKIVGTALVKTNHVAHRERAATSTGPIHVHTDVTPDQRGVIATIVDTHETALSAFRFEMPTKPAVGLDGRITSGSGDPCVMGIADSRSWRTKAGIVVSLQYSISDLCDGRVPDICSTVVLPTPRQSHE